MLKAAIERVAVAWMPAETAHVHQESVK